MERCSVLIGLGAAAAGSAALFGSGAFTQVSADRDVTVRVDEDSDALLALRANEKLETVTQEDGELVIDSDRLSGEDDTGFNPSAEVKIGDTDDDFGDGGDVTEEAFRIVNNFDQDIEVTIDLTEVDLGDDGEFALVVTRRDEEDDVVGDTERFTDGEEETKELDVGDRFEVAIKFDTDEESIEEDVITFEAEPSESD